ncbi:MAG: ATP-dependent RNA helicase HrpA [Verrucomicrobiota bacterium]
MSDTAQLHELNRLLPHCLLKDQLRLGWRLAAWLRERPPEQKVPLALAQWFEEAKASVQLRRDRQERLPPIEYPPLLPITARREDIVAAIRANQVLVIAGETGSGKTTQIPKMCLEAGLGIRARIGCTQPRRVAALSVSRRLAEELNMDYGREVGCKIRFSDQTSPQTYIKFMTDGILLAETQGDPLLTEYEVIILDEAHERSLNIDFLLGCLKQLLAKRDDLKLIITSATIDTQSFSRAFNDAPIIEVSGRLYPVDLVYAPFDVASEEQGDFTYVDAAVSAVENIFIESNHGDVLVFMPGERDILETRDALQSRGLGDTDLIPLFGRLSPTEQQRIFAPSPRRKIVIATNIAETSLTVPGIRYVVDTGLARISRYNPRTRTKRLPIEPVSQSSANQRKGRCGRVSGGICVRLYSEEDFAAREPYTQPEIQRANLAEVILRLKAFKLGDIETFPFLNPPTPPAILGGYQLLHELGALDDQREMTELGHKLARLPVDPTIGRMLLQAQREGATPEVLVIAAGLSIQDPRERPLERQTEADQAHRRFNHPKSDFLTLLNIWDAFHDQLESLRTQNQVRKFCKAHFLSYSRMREWRDIHAQLRDAMEDLGENVPHSQPATFEAIHRAILTGLWSHVSTRKERNQYQLGGNREVMLFPGSGLFARTAEKRHTPAPKEAKAKPAPANPQPQWLVAGEIVETSRLFARTVAEIDPLWIVELAPHLYRRGYSEPHWAAPEGRVLAREKITLNGLVVQDRMVPYGNVNPAEATEIFLRTALVEEALADHFTRPRKPLAPVRGQHSQQQLLAAAEADTETERDLSRLPALYRFLAHNQQLCHKIELWQTRLPSRIVTDLDQSLYEHYARRLKNLSSIPELNRFLHAQPDPAHCLCLDAAELLGPHAAAFNANAFPDTVPVGSHPVEVRYAYAPGAEHDGVTVRVPFTLAQVMDPAALDWAVPGLREPQILHLLQALPKALRRPLMPLPEKAREMARAVIPAGNAFLPALAEFIAQHYGVQVPLTEWNATLLPAHLRPRFEVVDADRKPVAQGRDLAALRQQLEQHDTTTESRAWQLAAQQWERYHLTDWSFGDLPEQILVAEIGGYPLHAYPALQWEDQEISLRLFRKPAEAAQAHAAAVPRLLERLLQRELAWLQKDLRSLHQWRELYTLPARALPPAAKPGEWGAAIKIQFAKTPATLATAAPSGLGTLEDLEASALDNLKQHLLGPRPAWPRTAAAFAALLAESRAGIPGLAVKLSDLTGEILKLRQTLLACRKPYPQLLADLHRLLPPQFLRYLPFERLPHLPRYLKALLVRAERAAVNTAKDQEKLRRLQPYLDTLEKLGWRPATRVSEKLEACRWLLEEYTVSLFAQELGTAEPVSPKKIEAALEAAKL